MSLFSALTATSNSLSAFESALTVVQNNINNSATPGYAAQSPSFETLPFDQSMGQGGGVEAGQPTDSRSTFAEQSVQYSASQLGLNQQQLQSLSAIQNLFDITGNTGSPSALRSIYSAFSSWASAPGDATHQQAVLSAAATVASAFRQTAGQISQAAATNAASLSSQISQVNALAARLSGYNAAIEAGQDGPSLRAQIYDTLQQLSELANITTTGASNGTITVLLGNGQTSLVNGASANVLNVSLFVPQPPPPANPNGPPSAKIVDSSGNNVTSEITSGSVAGLLHVQNSALPALQGDANTQGSLNKLAQTFADRVNSLLTSGIVSAGPPPVSGSALFSYDTTNATNTAASLGVSPGITGAGLAASDGTRSNGVALTLAGLENSSNPLDQIDGQSYSGYFGAIAAAVGTQVASAQSGESQAKDALTQAESVRQQISGVDLNAQATQILQFQQAYNAAAKMVSVIDDMTQTAIGLIKPSQVV